MVDVKGVTSEEVIELMAQQPLALRKRITETLQHGVAGLSLIHISEPTRH